ncbi:hypothetical protein Chor_011785 [Crotalus horridus]
MASPPAGGPMAIAMRLRNQLQAVYKMDPLRNEEEVKVKMKELNEHIVCFLCAGYFIDATTITECLHTFCKSCIVKFLQTSKYCPLCSTKIHETQPLLNLKLDRVMQDVVYKLVPGLQESEERRIREFYQSRGLERGSQASHEDPASDRVGLPYTTFDHSRAHYYRFDEHVTLCLEKQSCSGKEKSKHILQQKYVRCSVRAQIRHLRRVLCCRLELALQYVSGGSHPVQKGLRAMCQSPGEWAFWPLLMNVPRTSPTQVQILFDNEVLPDHLTLKQLWLTRWFGKVGAHSRAGCSLPRPQAEHSHGSLVFQPAPLHLNYSVKEKRR